MLQMVELELVIVPCFGELQLFESFKIIKIHI